MKRFASRAIGPSALRSAPNFCAPTASRRRAADDGRAAVAASPSAFPYVFRWDRQGRKGQHCKVTARGAMNARRLEFRDGYVMIAPGTSIRRRKAGE